MTAAELAAELDYPGGHTAMDGPHIDDQTSPTCHARTSRSRRIDPLGVRVEPAAGLVAAAAVTADGDAADAARRDQLTRWHHDDHTDHTDRRRRRTTGHPGGTTGGPDDADTRGTGRWTPWRLRALTAPSGLSPAPAPQPAARRRVGGGCGR